MKKLPLTALLISAFFTSETMTMEDDSTESQRSSLSMDGESSGEEGFGEEDLIPMTSATLEHRFCFPLYCEAIGNAQDGYKLEFFEFQLRDPIRPQLNTIIMAYNEDERVNLRAFYDKICSQNGAFNVEDEDTVHRIGFAITFMATEKFNSREISEKSFGEILRKIGSLKGVYKMKLRYLIKKEQGQPAN